MTRSRRFASSPVGHIDTLRHFLIGSIEGQSVNVSPDYRHQSNQTAPSAKIRTGYGVLMHMGRELTRKSIINEEGSKSGDRSEGVCQYKLEYVKVEQGWVARNSDGQ